MGSSSLNRGWTQAACIGIAESWPLDLRISKLEWILEPICFSQFLIEKPKGIIHELTVTQKGLAASPAVTIPLAIIQTRIMDCQQDGRPTSLWLIHYVREPSCGLNSILFGTGNRTSQCTSGYFQLPLFPSPISIISFFSLSSLSLIPYTLPSHCLHLSQ